MLPEKFLKRMSILLGDEYPDFLAALGESCERGFRLNKIKCDGEMPKGLLQFAPEGLSYARGGYVCNADSTGIGNTPEHHAGMIYVQDPGAMASAAVLDVKPDMWVADLCAAPGGKSTQIAEALGEGGFILSNEYVPKRAKILVGNFERMGITRGMVTSLDTAELAKMFSCVFDIVVADAPCSGEGMFRKDVPAAEEWSEENVMLCRERQLTILDNASGLVKGGGVLLYSTCTYSTEENEDAIDEFLDTHPDFRLIEVPEAVRRVTSDGIPYDGGGDAPLELCRRFYPHVSRGEGQFIALMERVGDTEPRFNYRDSALKPRGEELAAVENFFKNELTEVPRGRIIKYGNNLVLAAHGCPILPRGVFSAGVLIGELHGRVLVPSHQFFSAYGRLFKRQAHVDADTAKRYIAGLEIPASFEGSGFCSVIYRGAPLGGGKASGGIIKNHYPKGLRRALQ